MTCRPYIHITFHSSLRPVTRSCSNCGSRDAGLHPYRSPPAIARSVTWVVSDRVLRAQLVAHLFVNASQIRERLHRVHSTTRAFPKRAKLATSQLIKPGVDLAYGIRQQRSEEHTSELQS